MSILQFLDIEHMDDGSMTLPMNPRYVNIFGSIHGSAQYAFAEIATGNYLLQRYPAYRDKVKVFLRKSVVKYRKQARTGLTPKVQIGQEHEQQFIARLNDRGRASVEIGVSLLDETGDLTLSGTFEWFVSLIAAR